MKILIVEDEADIRENLALLLRMEGFESLEAGNGMTGLALARQYLPDLIISDVMMPEMDGYGFVAALRADPLTAAIPFIFLTGRTDRANRRHGMNLGADDYLCKPFTRDEVLDAVNARIKRVQVLEKTGPKSAAKSSGLPPEIKGYRMLRRLGAGGMSEVFLAEREADGLEVAVKLLDTRINQDASLLERFIQEYALLEQIEHPNVARIFAHGFTDEHAFITMEYFAHGDIKRRIAAGFSPFEALSIALQVAYALSQIHALGIVHRDVKPDNLMLREDGSVALIDFGVAKHGGQNLEHTQQGEIVGSPYYLSPEQAGGKPVSPASDIYSLGVIFYEMVTGKRPYLADSMEALLYQHVHAPPPRFEPKFAEFQNLLDQMMHKDPSKRFPSAQALADYIVNMWPTMLRLMHARALPHGAKKS
ncbi:MAG: protein kinase [Rhodoferax sp.]|nr:protein kinase [Rhodoferax sp.]